ncbi:MAG: NAD(P)/FAD-dependent oxidoreductase [Cyanobacteria bacterium SZAS LIN-3]|nr:NAD(P)/FAD-dependent oxidoreductase [Cyanobacteria bacterium SZAS LIN-3]
MSRVAIIIGAGPAGLTAAYELLMRSDIRPIIIEKSDVIGGLARTIEYKGNFIDIGPHRFFSKSDRVMDWWMTMMPVQAKPGETPEITYHNAKRNITPLSATSDVDAEENVLITLQRQTRIYYLRKFFDYPISLKVQTFANLGLPRTIRIGFSYIKSALLPIKPERNLEDFFTNRFGRELYLTFFKDYTEKVWGISCSKISAAWGAQRVKGLSIMKVLLHAAKKFLGPVTDIRQKSTETSLVEQFLYPKKGTGSMWEEVARRIKEKGGEIHLNQEVLKLSTEALGAGGSKVTAVEIIDSVSGEKKTLGGDFFFSTMPIKELVRKLDAPIPADVREIAEGLVYRDFIEVGLLVKELKVTDGSTAGRKIIADNWLYIQESDVLIGRLQIYNNWGNCMVADPNTVWLGLEYFCNETDELWGWPDEKLKELGAQELDKIGIIDKKDVLDAMVIRMPKTYPGYFGSYDRFDDMRKHIDTFENLFLVGRNGMHKYNNQDHSMLTAMVAVDNIIDGVTTKENIWDVNTEMEYHEEKQEDKSAEKH